MNLLLQSNSLEDDFGRICLWSVSACVSSGCQLSHSTFFEFSFLCWLNCIISVTMKVQPDSRWTHGCGVRSLRVRSKCLSTFFQTEGSWGRHLRWRCIGKATGLALPITHRRGRHTPTQPAPHTAWVLSSKISGMISVKLGVYFHFPSSYNEMMNIGRAGLQFESINLQRDLWISNVGFFENKNPALPQSLTWASLAATS